MAREAKDPHASDRLGAGMGFTIDKDGKLNVDRRAMRDFTRGGGAVSEQQSYLDSVYENYKKLEAEREAKRALEGDDEDDD